MISIEEMKDSIFRALLMHEGVGGEVPHIVLSRSMSEKRIAGVEYAVIDGWLSIDDLAAKILKYLDEPLQK